MAVPSLATGIVATDLARLTSALRNQATLQALLTSYLNRAQDLENQIWAVFQAGLLDNAQGIWLDWIGGRVGQPRNNLSDTDYLQVIKLRILANKSSGTAEDVIQIAAILASPSKANYVDQFPAAFIVEALDLNGVIPAVSLLSEASATGTYGQFNYSTWPASGVLRFASHYSTLAGNGVLDSHYGGVTTPATLAATSAL